MSDEYDKLVQDRAISLRAAARAFLEPVTELIYQDPHQWSRRPCSTCQSITSIIGQPFGCYRYEKEHPRG